MAATVTPNLLETARAYWNAGLSPMPRVLGHVEPSYIDAAGSIHPITWGEYKTQQPNWSTVEQWFTHGTRDDLGITLLTGNHAHPRAADIAYLQILDIESAELFEDFQEQCQLVGYGPILHRCVIERTPSGGGHIALCCPTIGPTQKIPLARRATDKKILIELLQHQPCTVTPTSLQCKPEHPPDTPYRLTHGEWTAPLSISTEQREQLINLARLYNEVPDKIAEDRATNTTAGDRPGDRLNTQADITWWDELLKKHGWRDVSRAGLRSRGVWYFQRPGKIGAEPSATYGKTGQCLYVFSSNAQPFEPDTAYTAFSAYALLEHDGDFHAAARALPKRARPPRATIPAMYGPSHNGTLPPPGTDAGIPYDRPLPYGDVYNARRLVAAHGDQLRYCGPWDKWLTWLGTHWAKDHTGDTMYRAKQTMIALLQEARGALDGLTASMMDLATQEDPSEQDRARLKATQKAANAFFAHAAKSLNNGPLTAMVKQAQSENGIAILPDVFDRDLWALNVLNGTIDLRTGALAPHCQDDMLTKCLRLAYEPDAACPTWERFLWRAMGGSAGDDDPDMHATELEARQGQDTRAKTLIGFLQRAIGYSLTGDTSEQCLFILHGPTKTGKTTFLETIGLLLGDYAQQAEMTTFLHKEKDQVRNDLADLAASRFVSAVEVQEGKRLAESLVKQLTGADRVKARFLYEEYFTYKPQFKVFLGTNHKPVIRDTDDAIWERIRLIPFTVHIPRAERDKTLSSKLEAELPGILAWAVRGCLLWQKHGLHEPEAVEQATLGYRNEMDHVGQFIEDMCLVGEAYQVKPRLLYEVYQSWCTENTQEPHTGTAFGKRLADRGLLSESVNGQRWRRGIGIKNAPDRSNFQQ